MTRVVYPPFGAGSLANPTASVGLAAVNGTALTAMRSDGAPVLDQTAAFALPNLAATGIVNAASGAVPLTVSGYSLTGSQNQSAFALTGTLNTSGSPDVFSIAIVDTARGATTKLFNVYAGSAGNQSQFSIDRIGNVAVNGNMQIVAGKRYQISADLFWTRGGAATFQLGDTNAASPVAQTLQVQNAATGNNNGAATRTEIASLSVGNGTSGDFVFQTGKNGNGSGVLATATTALTIKGETQAVVVAAGKTFQVGNAAATGLAAGVLAATTNATLVITDSTGQAYRIPCII